MIKRHYLYQIWCRSVHVSRIIAQKNIILRYIENLTLKTDLFKIKSVIQGILYLSLLFSFNASHSFEQRKIILHLWHMFHVIYIYDKILDLHLKQSYIYLFTLLTITKVFSSLNLLYVYWLYLSYWLVFPTTMAWNTSSMFEMST